MAKEKWGIIVLKIYQERIIHERWTVCRMTSRDVDDCQKCGQRNREDPSGTYSCCQENDSWLDIVNDKVVYVFNVDSC